MIGEEFPEPGTPRRRRYVHLLRTCLVKAIIYGSGDPLANHGGKQRRVRQ